jgi:hypothetical protein
MSDVALNAILRAHGYIMSADFKTTAASAHGVRTGKLAKSFKEKLVIKGGDTIGLSFIVPRYGYILHHGVKAQGIKTASSSYETKGFKGSGFINNVLDRHTGKIADDIAAVYGKDVAEKIRF